MDPVIATIICTAITSICGIVCAVTAAIVGKSQKTMDENQKRTEMRAQRRAEESELSMELMFGACALSLVTAKKMASIHTNGDVEEAMHAADEAQRKYKDFVQKQAAAQVAKV